MSAGHHRRGGPAETVDAAEVEAWERALGRHLDAAYRESGTHGPDDLADWIARAFGERLAPDVVETLRKVHEWAEPYMAGVRP